TTGNPARSFVTGWLRKDFAKTVSAPIPGSVFFGSTTTSLSSFRPRDARSGASPKSDSVLLVPGGNSTSRKNRARPRDDHEGGALRPSGGAERGPFLDGAVVGLERLGDLGESFATPGRVELA